MEEKKIPDENKLSLSEEQKAMVLNELGITAKEFKSLKKKVKQLQGRDDRAFMEMLRVSNRNHYTLNQMVDRKARILLSVNALILSLIIGKFILNHQMHDWKFILLVFFGFTCIISIVFSMLSIIQEKSHGSLTEASIKMKKGNPLFFGNFKNMAADSYENTLMEMVNDRDFIYRSIIQDTYFLGQALEQKRKHIKASLIIFIVGLCISLIFSFALKIFLGSA